MDWSWLSAELAIAVTGPLSPRFPWKNMVYERKVNIKEELHQRIFDAARRMNIEFQISVAP
jgi:hypothetical protein